MMPPPDSGALLAQHAAQLGAKVAETLRALAADIEQLIACFAPTPAEAAPEAAAPDVATRAPLSLSAKYTPARIDVLREHYPAGMPADEILPLINALPGEKFTPEQIAWAANYHGLLRPPGFAAAARRRFCAKKRAAGDPTALATKTLDLPRHTPARDDVLRQHYPAGMPAAALVPLLNALPGRPVTFDDVSRLACDIGLCRPAGFKGTRKAAPAADCAELRTKAREAVLHATWRTDKPRAGILALLNMQAGPRLTLAQMCAWATELGLDEQPPAAPPAAAPAPAKTGAPAARKTPVLAKGAPPKLAAYQPPQSAAAPPPRIPTPAERKRAAEVAAIATHIAQKGVTLCPPAIAAVTTHTPTPAEAAAIREIVDAAETARRTEMEENQARMRRNRALKLAGKRPLERVHA